MSIPARQLPPPTPSHETAPIPSRETAPIPSRVRPTRTPAARPATLPPLLSPRRARRGNPSAFWILTALIVTAMVVGIVSISALLVRSSFRVDQLRARIADAARTQQELHQDVAELSSPSRIHRWAREEGFVVPDGVVILSVPGERA